MTQPRDDLLERYAEAVAQDPRRPSDRVRNAARAHAQMLRDQAAAVQRVEGVAPAKPAANQSQWTVSLVASLAVVGLAGLIFVQIDRGTPDVREAGWGTTAPTHAPPHADTAQTPAPTRSTAQDTVANTAAPASGKTAARVTRKEAAPVQPATPAAGNAAPVRADAAPPPAETEMAARSNNKVADLAAMAPPAAMPQRARQMEGTAPGGLYLDAARTGNTDTLQKLLAQGVSINTRDDTGNTALMVAVRHRQAAIVRMLLSMGADTRLTNAQGMTALQLASHLGLDDMVQLLQVQPQAK